MTDSITPNLGLTLPTVYPGDQWGGKLNTNFSAIDLNAGVVTAKFTANTAKNLATVAALLADTTLAYATGTGKVVVATSEIVEAGGFRYQVAASGASDQHVTTAGGVKLYVQPGAMGYPVGAFSGADYSAKLQAAIDAVPSTGGVITAQGIAGPQTFSQDVTVNKRCRIYLPASQITMGTYKIAIQANSVNLIGVGRQDENNSATLFITSATGNTAPIEIKHPTTATPLFAVKLQDFEIAGTGAAATDVNVSGVRNIGGRYCEYHNILVFNLTSTDKGAFYFTGNGAVVNGFGATNMMYNCSASTVKYGVRADAAGGSQSTHGMIYGGFLFGAASGLYTECESWRLHDTDMGGAICIDLQGAADDTSLINPRFEAATGTCIRVNTAISRCYCFGPAFINVTGTTVDDAGNKMTLIANGSSDTFNLLRGTRAQRVFSDKGVTATLAGGASQSIANLSSGGVWLAVAQQADGGTAWRAAYVVFSSGAAITATSIVNSNVTFSDAGSAVLQITNTSGSSINLEWSIVKLQGSSQFST